MLHDIGKIGVPDSILNKPDQLNENEREIMKNHPLWECGLSGDRTVQAGGFRISYHTRGTTARATRKG